jgi:MarR family transcriptional regulator for hemolysin
MADAAEPIGLFVTRRGRELSRSFEAALAGAGSSLATWLVLTSLAGGMHQSQREIAEELGIEGPTLTHHLNRMEAAGFVTRERNPADRRAHDVTMTAAGNQAFRSLIAIAQDFDARLRIGFTDRELATLRRLLQRLVENSTTVNSTIVRRDAEEAP